MLPIILLIGIGMVVAGFYWYKVRRIKMWKKIAKEWNWDFIQDTEERIPPELEDIPMAEDFIFLTKTRVKGIKDGIQVTLFDLIVFEFKISKNFTYTAMTFQHNGLDLPLFTFKPRTKFEDGIHENRGVQFPEDFDFTQKFRIDALDYAAVRKWFTKEVRDLLRDEEDVSLIGQRHTLFLHKFPGHLSRYEIEKSVELGTKIVNALLNVANSKKT